MHEYCIDRCCNHKRRTIHHQARRRQPAGAW